MSINFSSQKPNALIVGGTGKIGRHLVRFLLNRDFIIKILTRNSYNPWQKEENVKIIKKELEYNNVSVVIPRRECVQTIARRNKLIKQKNINLL